MEFRVVFDNGGEKERMIDVVSPVLALDLPP